MEIIVLTQIADSNFGDASLLAQHFLRALNKSRVWREASDADRLFRMLIVDNSVCVDKASAAWQEAMHIVFKTRC